jgi:hypothetical protein
MVGSTVNPVAGGAGGAQDRRVAWLTLIQQGRPGSIESPACNSRLVPSAWT